MKTITRGDTKRWALSVIFKGNRQVLGKFCWPNPADSDPRIRTFRTREQARLSREQLTSYRDEARVVAVEISVAIVDGR